MRSEIGDPEAGIDLAIDVRSFFAGLLAEARRAQAVNTTRAVESYLVALLADFARPQQKSEEDSKPFTLLLDEALSSSVQERFARLRGLGDRVLYTTGFFRLYLEQRGVKLDYVKALGARAYDAASGMLHARMVCTDDPARHDVLGELAEHFDELAGLLAEASDMILARSANSPSALLRVYERWLRTGSAALASALGERGLNPQRNLGGLH